MIINPRIFRIRRPRGSSTEPTIDQRYEELIRETDFFLKLYCGAIIFTIPLAFVVVLLAHWLFPPG